MILTATMLFGTLAHAQATRRLIRLPGLFDYFKSEWLGGEDDKASPLVYLVEQPPNSTLPSHFHRQNEFQVFVDGDGTLGQRQIQPVTVHYAGAYTGYGPIVAGPVGLSYLTIRAVFDSGAFMVDSQRERMIRGPKLQLHADPFHLQSTGELARFATPQIRSLFPPQSDRPAAYRVSLPPGHAYRAAVATGPGQFHIVLAGSVRHEEREIGKWECIFTHPGESPAILTACSAGSELLGLHIPSTAIEYAVKLQGFQHAELSNSPNNAR